MLDKPLERWQYSRYITRVGSEFIPNDFSLYSPEATVSSDNVEDVLMKIVGRLPNENEAGIDLLLNKLGSQGWEVFHIETVRDIDSSMEITEMFLKRKIG